LYRNPIDYEAEASVDVEFWLIPAKEPGPSVAERVGGDARISFTSYDYAEPTLEALMRMWEPMLRGYSAVGHGFWEAFRTLYELAILGHWPSGRFLLPGPPGYDCVVRFAGGCREGGGEVGASVMLEPENDGDVPPQPEDWDALMNLMPEPGFGPAEAAFSDSMLAALRRTWAADPGVTVARTGLGPTHEGWVLTKYSWLRFPLSEDEPGYLLETLTLQLTPRAEGEAGPLATVVTVTELVAWDPERRQGRPGFAALAPARDFFLESYLSPGHDFWQAFAELEPAPGLTEELPGAGAASLLVTVEEVSEEDGAYRRRYTFSYLLPAEG